MKKVGLSEIDLISGKIESPKGFEINREKIKNDIATEIIKYFNLPPIKMTFNSDIPTTGSG